MKTNILKKTIGAIVVSSVLMSGVAQAGFSVDDNWNLNLSVANGLSGFAGLTDSVGIDHLNMVGASTVEQIVLGGVSLGNSFVDEGYFQFTNFSPEGGGLTSLFGLGNAAALVGVFSGLTGTLNLDGTTSFDTGVAFTGAIDMLLDMDGVLATTGDQLVLASYGLIAPSGGSDLDFFGGAGATATLDLSLTLLSSISGLFTDENDVEYGATTLHTVNTDALLDQNFGGGTGIVEFIDGAGDGYVEIHTQNNGQYNIATEVPEPGSLALFGLGLMGLASIKRKRT